MHGCRAREPPETIGRQQPHAAACAEFRALASRGRCSAPVRGGDGRWREAKDHGREAHGACAAAHAKFQSGRSTHGRRDRPPAVQDAAEVESRARPSGVRGAGQTGPDASVDAHGASGTRPTRLRGRRTRDARCASSRHGGRQARMSADGSIGEVRFAPNPNTRIRWRRKAPTHTASSFGHKFGCGDPDQRTEEAIQRSIRRTNRGRSS